MLHFVPDRDDPYGITDRIRGVLGPGSYTAISHAVPAPGVEKVAEMYTAEATEAGVARTPEQIARLFKGYELVPPGVPRAKPGDEPRVPGSAVVPVNRWRPSLSRGGGDDVWVHGGVGRKPRSSSSSGALS